MPFWRQLGNLMTSAKAPSAFSPLRHKSFAVMWGASTLSFTGTWMHEVGAGWQMAQLTSSPLLIALVQTSTSLPVFCFALIAGALADRADKRRYLMAGNCFNALVAMTLAVLAFMDALTPFRLLLLTGLLGTGIAFIAPAWQSIVPSLIPAENRSGGLPPELPQALALNSLGINVSRAIGPALAAMLIVAYGASASFLANGFSFLIVVAAVFWWRPDQTLISDNPTRPTQTIIASISEGLGHVWQNMPFRSTLIRSLGFFVFASSLWALMPVLALKQGAANAVVLGQFISAVGVGAVAGALALPKLRSRFTINRIAFLGALMVAGILIMLGFTAADTASPFNTTALICALCFLGGAGWICVLTSMHLSAQTALPDWVRARGLAVNLMVFFGGMAAGSALWGQITAVFGLSMAYWCAGLSLIFSQLLLLPIPLGTAYYQIERSNP